MSDVELLPARDVPLGGLRSMTVRRTLPHRDRPTIGAWCFVDHYGPNTVGVDAPPMDVAPHPHIGLQTVSWLFEGEVEHRDSAGVHAMVRPGEVNLMSAGHGISHSEVSTPDTQTLHGVQLWLALPSTSREGPMGFQHYAAPAESLGNGATARVFIGSLPGVSPSPVATDTPLLGAELTLKADATCTLSLNPAYEHGFLIDSGEVSIDGQPVERNTLVYLEVGRAEVSITTAETARIILLGGEPFDEPIVMWWNFVGRTHEDIAQARADWESQGERFGHVEGYRGAIERIPAPALPGVRLKARSRRNNAG